MVTRKSKGFLNFKLFLAIFLLVCIPGLATTYYVDYTGGLDTNDGQSPEQAWKTINKVNISSFSAGDNILLKRGEKWREMLTISWSGASGNHVAFRTYGTGAKPIIKGSDLITTWTATGGTSITYPAQNTDDCYIRVTAQDWYDNEVLLMGETGTNARESGIRFINIIVPKDAIIISSFVRLTSQAAESGTTVNLTISAENTDEPATFSNYADFVARADSTATVAWNDVAAWVDGTQYDTPSINTIIDEVTSYENWESGDDIVIFIRDNSSTANAVRRASSYNYVSAAEKAELHITYGWANVWEAACTIEPKIVFFDGVLGTKQASAAACTSARDWHWASNVLYVYSTSDPDTAYTDPGIEAGARTKCIYISNKSYITIDGLDVRHCNGVHGNQGGAISVNSPSIASTNLIIQNCTAQWNNWAGIAILGASGLECTSITIQDNTLSYCSLNQAESGGIWTDFMDSSFVRRNTISYDGEHAIRMRRSDNNVTERNYCFLNGSSGFTLTDASSGADKPTGNIICLNKFDGNDTIDGTKANFEVVNSGGGNYFYLNLSSNSQTHGFRASNAGADYLWNNVFFNSDDKSIYIYNSPIIAKNNIIHTSGGYHIDSYDNSPTLDHNLYYPDGSGKFRWNNIACDDFADWKNDSSQDANSPNPDDPHFTNPSNGDFTLLPDSPCIDAGTDVGLIEDFAGNPVGNIILGPIKNILLRTIIPIVFPTLPDIGAYEYQY